MASRSHCQVVTTFTSYVGHHGFKSRPGYWLSWLRFFVIFLNQFRLRQQLKICHNHFSLCPFQNNIHKLLYHRAYISSTVDTVYLSKWHTECGHLQIIIHKHNIHTNTNHTSNLMLYFYYFLSIIWNRMFSCLYFICIKCRRKCPSTL